ncbi:uncharacterized protein BO80DRAFT_445831 [Aspergillus ibericus CBS 121593]|uniref:Actin-like ATPase domain-containing protein n=1 Tax=Aspergillus ibericus CBS 121593 TaxID=1448316 RepID=A0A395GYI1_9EURO|nr:hypothetical protein BO80DRAFT_445831 [Aspergillus ibericus CBS 121593]RAL00129.1 hypothetical protein BO80DRAFT_445831 [Aspergillus ibericus CBS 121593]
MQHVFIVGGGAHIPYVTQSLNRHFNAPGLTVVVPHNPHLTVLYGAAMYAAVHLTSMELDFNEVDLTRCATRYRRNVLPAKIGWHSLQPHGEEADSSWSILHY